MNRSIRLLVPLLVATLLGACAVPYPAYSNLPETNARTESSRVEYGVVSAIERAHDKAPSVPSGAGAAVGGVIGAVIGREIGGKGDSRTAGTMIGALLGAMAGREIERQHGAGRDGVRVVVRLDRGGERSVEQADGQDLRIGDRVAVDNGRVVRVGRATSALQFDGG